MCIIDYYLGGTKQTFGLLSSSLIAISMVDGWTETRDSDCVGLMVTENASISSGTVSSTVSSSTHTTSEEEEENVMSQISPLKSETSAKYATNKNTTHSDNVLWFLLARDASV